MKHILTAIIIILAIPCFVLGQIKSQKINCEQTAKELESKTNKITQNLDKIIFERFVSGDAVFITNDGLTRSKKQQAEELKNISNLPVSTIEFTTEDVKIRVCREINIVITGKDVIKINLKNEKESESESFWFIRIYEKREEQWQLVYTQLTENII